MAFTGYKFEDSSEIEHHLEKPRCGPTSIFCTELAKQLQCYVVAGYPERLQQEELEEHIRHDQVVLDDSDLPSDGSRIRKIVGANSAILYGPDGEWVGGYRKSNLFRTDKTWAAAGSGFATFNLPPPLQRVTLAICMDLNPFPGATWTVEDGPYELADHCISSQTNLLVLLNAWLDPGEETDDEHSWSTLRYWAARLRPLWCRERKPSEETGTTASASSDPSKDTLVAVCNRTGEENGTKYVGCSALFKMERSSGRPKLVDMMTREEEGIRIWNIQ